MVLGVATMLAAGAGAPAHAAGCTGLSSLFGGCKTTTTTTPPPPPAPTPAPVPTQLPSSPAPAPILDLLASAHQLLDLANAERAIAGLPALQWRDDASALAVEHSQHMADAGRIFHNDQLFTSTVRNALAAKTLGENVGFGGSVAQVHAALMSSEGHRNNILSPKFRVAGMGIVKGAGSLYMTQVFIEPSGAAPKAVPKPAPRPTTTAAKPKVAAKTAARPAAPATTAAPTTAVTEAPTTTEAPPTTEAVEVPAEPELALGTTAAMPPPEASDTTGAQALALSLLVAVSVWAGRVRTRARPLH